MNRRPMWLAAALPWLPMLGIGFLNDDYAGIVHFGSRGWAGVLDEFHPKDFEFLRPLGFLIFRSELSSFGPDPWLFHTTHLALFVIAAWLAGRLAARLSGPQAAGWASALALLYPGRVEVVAWIAAIFDLLALLLTTATLLLATAPEWDRNRMRAPVLAALCFFAPLAKESAYAIPIVVLGWEFFNVLGRASNATRVLRCASAVVGSAAAFAFRLVALGGIGGYAGNPFVSAARKVQRLPEMLARVVFIPVNPDYGPASRILSALCLAAVVGVIAALLRGSWRRGARPLAAGLLLTLIGLLPALPYLDPVNLTWSQSRLIGLSGLGVALSAAVSLANAPKRWSGVAGGFLVAVWAATAILNGLPWLGSARCRDTLLAGIERVTVTPGTHWVWVAGPINDYRGAQLLGGRLGEAVTLAMPKRVIHVDSEFLQQQEHRPVGPPTVAPGASLHVFRFDPSGPQLTPFDWHAAAEEP